MSTHGTDYIRVRSGYRTYESMDSFFDGELHQVQIPGFRQLDWTAFSGHAQSLSVTPPLDHPGYAAFQAALRVYFDTHSKDGIFTMPTVCWITAARFSDQE